ncbi:hypothetical protein Arub01_26260 [Actinomadura rubrobrunea]|uniref:Pycsar effector protein domain-containing protein n=1 Tax=Actinomadura rubrobrunea TaxID=115335 RepID=A0A9W6UWL6_9ACTN|nr:Pycsar system effector family protein [Actinomadura rubrobrunea]GLW64382.1 hypothetical protein Arub01_26260 [Actinomadura rubrobrunea]
MAQATGHPSADQRRRQDEDDQESFEAYAWRVNQALHDWTAKVDAKASVILAIETAILSMIVAFVRTGKRIQQLTPLETWTFRVGVALVACAIVLAGAAVFPQLNRREAKRNWRRSYVYFGHPRRWRPAELVDALESGNEQRHKIVLGTQLIALSKIIWREHSFLQCSMSLVAIGNIAIWVPLLIS